jgi:hypothetical protein
MIYLLPDQVLGLLGNNGNMHEIGKDSESKIHGMFMSMGGATRMASKELGRENAAKEAAEKKNNNEPRSS